MLSRFLFIFLIIIAWMLLVRVIKNWLARRRRGGRGGREISGEWEVIRPVGQFGTKQLEKLRDLLEVGDDTGLRTIATVLEVAQRTLNGPEMDPAEVRGLLHEPDDVFRARLFDGEEVNVDGWLIVAADTLGDHRPELSDYETRGAIISAYQEVYPKNRGVFFRPEHHMRPVPNAPPAPGIDPRYMHFFELRDAYDGDPEYQALYGLKAEELPDSAMLPLLHLTTIDDGTVGDVLVRYGERLYPAVIEYLCNAEQYAKDVETVPYQRIFKLAGAWQQSYAEPLFRAAFSSGWNDCVAALPAEPWAENLIAGFAESPYGAPGRS